MTRRPAARNILEQTRGRREGGGGEEEEGARTEERREREVVDVALAVEVRRAREVGAARARVRLGLHLGAHRQDAVVARANGAHGLAAREAARGAGGLQPQGRLVDERAVGARDGGAQVALRVEELAREVPDVDPIDGLARHGALGKRAAHRLVDVVADAERRLAIVVRGALPDKVGDVPAHDEDAAVRRHGKAARRQWCLLYAAPAVVRCCRLLPWHSERSVEGVVFAS